MSPQRTRAGVSSNGKQQQRRQLIADATAERLGAKKPNRVTIDVCLDAGLSAELARARGELKKVQDQVAFDEKRRGRTDVDLARLVEVQTFVDEIEDDVAANSVRVTFQALPHHEYEALKAEFPCDDQAYQELIDNALAMGVGDDEDDVRRKVQRPDYHPDRFPPQLIHRCAVEIVRDVDGNEVDTRPLLSLVQVLAMWDGDGSDDEKVRAAVNDPLVKAFNSGELNEWWSAASLVNESRATVALERAGKGSRPTGSTAKS